MDLVEYFAIGSMMNPISLNMRGLNPIKSRPGILKNYELIFVMAHGMAAAKFCNSSSIHGVLHRVSRAELDVLNKSESTYVIGKKVVINLYKNEEQENLREDVKETPKQAGFTRSGESMITNIEAIVYVLNDQIVSQDPERFALHPPTERYIEILKGGALHYGLEQEYVKRNFFEINVTPRPSKEKLNKVLVPDEFYGNNFPTCQIGSGATERFLKSQYNEYFFLAVNEKLCRSRIDKTWRCYDLLQPLVNKNIQSVFIAATKYWYEPKYGVPESYDQMCLDHREQIEDIMVTSFMSGNEAKRWEVVARITE